MYYVYVLESQKDHRLYKGLTKNIEQRLAEHNSGKTQSTKGYLPWKLVYQESFETLIEARAREKYLKSGRGREYLKKILSLHPKINDSVVQRIPARRTVRQAGNRSSLN